MESARPKEGQIPFKSYQFCDLWVGARDSKAAGGLRCQRLCQRPPYRAVTASLGCRTGIRIRPGPTREDYWPHEGFFAAAGAIPLWKKGRPQHCSICSGPRWRALFFEGRALTTLPLDAEKVTHSRRICGSPRFALSAFELGMRLLLVDTNKGPDEERVGAEFPPIGHSGDAQQLHRPMPEEVRPWYEDGVTKPLDIVLRN